MSSSQLSLSATSASSLCLPIKSAKPLNQDLLLNFGFDSNLLNLFSSQSFFFLKKSVFRKINSANAVEQISPSTASLLLSNQNKEAEDVELYREDDEEYMPSFINDKVTHFVNKENNFYSTEENKTTIEKQVIKAYMSKHKSKFYRIYQNNSVETVQSNKYKMFHKCNYPNCGRTFSSSGWLRAHFDEHLKDLSHSKYTLLFERFVLKK